MNNDDKKNRFTETGAKDHDPQQKAELRKSEDNVSTANQQHHTPNHPHPGDKLTGKHSGGSSD
jgi:hypothetical protein